MKMLTNRGELALVDLVRHFWMLINNQTTDNAHWMVGEDFFFFFPGIYKGLFIHDYLNLVVALGNTFEKDGFVLILFQKSFEWILWFCPARNWQQEMTDEIGDYTFVDSLLGLFLMFKLKIMVVFLLVRKVIFG